VTKELIGKEFKKIDYEFRVNNPNIVLYPPSIVKQRELLLYAQIHLNNVLNAKLRKDKRDERFEAEMYHKVMETYYNYGKNK